MEYKYLKSIFYTCCAAIFVTIFMSCSNYKNIVYFKNVSDSAIIYQDGKNIEAANVYPLTIKPDDLLQININTLDAATNGAINLSSSPSTLSSIPNGSVNSPNLNGYLVDKNGAIELPLIGSIQVAGLTTERIRAIIKNKASQIFKNPVVNVRIINFRITVLGEVLHPGTYTVDGENINVLDALGLAGDMTIYGKRNNVLLLRKIGNNIEKVARFDLNNTNSLASPFFNLHQGDILYVEPVKAKAASTDISATRNYALAGAILSVLIVTISRINF